MPNIHGNHQLLLSINLVDHFISKLAVSTLLMQRNLFHVRGASDFVQEDVDEVDIMKG